MGGDSGLCVAELTVSFPLLMRGLILEQKASLTSLPSSNCALLALLPILMISGCHDGQSQYAGLTRSDAAEAAHAYIENLQPLDTSSETEIVKATRTSGKKAWLVRVTFDGGSGNICVYAWRDTGHQPTLQLDSGCLHWDYG